MIPGQDRTIRFLLAAAAFPLTCCRLMIENMRLIRRKPAGKLIRIGSRTLHAVVSGTASPGKPTVILEAGMGGNSLDWSLVQPALAEHAAVLAYDRAGFGWSSRQTGRADAESYAEDLERLLDSLGLTPPYLLVGFSYGGLIARLFAARRPDGIAGMVLVDAVHESRYASEAGERRDKELAFRARRHRLGYLTSPIGLPRLVRQPVGSKRLPPHIQRVSSSLGYRSQAYEAAYAELLAAAASAKQLAEAPPLPANMPITVLSAGKQGEAWLAMQRKLLELSDRTEHRIVPDSWHSIPVHKPEAVAQAVLDLLARAELGAIPRA